MKTVFLIFSLLIVSALSFPYSVDLCPFINCNNHIKHLDPKCNSCNYVVALAENYGRDQLDFHYRNENCSSLITNWEIKCDDFHMKHISSIFDKSNSEKDSELLCNELIECDEKGDLNHCSLCILIVQFTEHYIQHHYNSTEIINKLDKFCETEATKYKPMCEYIVNNTLPMIIDYLEQHDDPNQVCTLIGLC